MGDWGVPCASVRRFPPELINAHSKGSNLQFTHQTDVWMYGLVAYEVCQDAQSAFSKTWDDHVVPQKILSGFRPKQTEKCPEAIYDLLMKCWAANPMDRPDFAWIRAEIEKLREYAEVHERRASEAR